MDLEQITGLSIYPRSVVEMDELTYFLAHNGKNNYLGILGKPPADFAARPPIRSA